MILIFAVMIDDFEERFHHAAGDERLPAFFVRRQVIEERKECRGVSLRITSRRHTIIQHRLERGERGRKGKRANEKDAFDRSGV